MSESASPPDDPEFTPLLVTAKDQAAQGIFCFALRRPDEQPLPRFTAGAHVTVVTPAGPRRNYSLCSDPADSGCYQIAVKRDARGRGGSVSMVDGIRQGDLLPVSEPRNNFALPERADHQGSDPGHFIFVAGGIGITPILSMVRHLAGSGEGRFKLYYLTRDPGSTAFAEDLAELGHAGSTTIHHDLGDPARAFDLWPLFEKPGRGYVYCCGPRGLMDDVRDMTGHWPGGRVHFESFGVDAAVEAANTQFVAKLERSGMLVQVPVHQTLLQALRAAGRQVPSSCESGTCGSCRTGLLGGTADHRDMVLTDEEKQSQIMVCVSRALSPDLVLDL